MPPRRATRSSSTKSKPATPSKPASTKKAPVKRGRSKKEQVKEVKEEEEEVEQEEQEEEVVQEAPTKRPRRATRDRSDSDDMTDDNGFNLKWSTHGSLLVLSNDELSKGNSKIAAFDMDGTLIRPKSGKVFPQGRNDWVLLFPEVATKLRELHEDGYKLVIFTNQNGISTGTQPKAHITGKIQDLIRHFNVPMLAFVATADDLYRKPAIDMWTFFTKHYNTGVSVDLSKSWYVGDAAGRAKAWDGNAKTKKDFSCGDRKFAKNIGLNFGTPEEFFLAQKPAPFSWGGIDLSSHIAEDVKDGSHTSATAAKAASKGSAAVATSHGEAKAAFEGSLGLGEEQEIVVFVGFPAAGKSTFARKWFVPAGYVHVNQDTLKTKEKCIKVTRESVAEGKSVVVDNTNGDPATRAQYIAIAKDAGIRIRCFQFMTTMELAQHMNMFREKFVGIKHVSRIAYNVYKSKFKAPTTSEGFTEVKQINFVAEFHDDKAKQLFYQMT